MPQILVSHFPDGSKRKILFPVLESMLGPSVGHLVSVVRFFYISFYFEVKFQIYLIVINWKLKGKIGLS